MSVMLTLVQIISAPSIFISIIVLSKFRFARRTTIVATALVSSFLLLTDFLVVFLLGHHVDAYPILDFAYRMANIAILVVFVLILTRQKTSRSLFVVLSVCAGTTIIDTISLTIRTMIGLYALELVFELLLYLFIILVFYRIRKPAIHILEYLEGKILPLCLPLVFLLLCFLLQISIPNRLTETPGNIPVALLLCGVTITMYVHFYYLFHAMFVRSALERNAMAMKLAVSSLESQNRIAAQNEKHVSVFKHDLRHILQMMSGFLNSGDATGAGKLLSSLEKNIGEWGSSAIRSFSGHQFVDATLCHYVDLAKSLGIDITVSMSAPDEIKADITELAVVLANALENAVNACKAMPDGEPRSICLDGHRRGKQYFLEIANTCNGNVKFDPTDGTPISHEKGHGFGSRSIAYFAEKNQAVLQYRMEGRRFHLRLLMQAC